MLALDPTSSKAERNLGRALASKGDGGGAIDAFRRSVALDPANTAVRMDLAGALLGAGRLDDAIAAYRGTLDRAPGTAYVYSA